MCKSKTKGAITFHSRVSKEVRDFSDLKLLKGTGECKMMS